VSVAKCNLAKDTMTAFNLLGISGSLRAASVNTMLMHEAVRLFGDCDFTQGNIRLPLYDGDLEDTGGIPGAVQKLADQITAADAVFISTPEYNQNLPGVLKNALDWISRTKGRPLAQKPVAIMSAAAGRAGGARSQYSLRHALTSFQPMILQGPEVMIAGAKDAFDENGRLVNEISERGLTRLMTSLRELAEMKAGAQ